jgi:hypothetical protein
MTAATITTTVTFHLLVDIITSITHIQQNVCVQIQLLGVLEPKKPVLQKKKFQKL